MDVSLSYEAVSHLAPGVTREEYARDFSAPKKCTNLAQFLERSHNGYRLMQSEESLRHVTQDIFRQWQDDGVIYGELRFAPLLHLEQGLSAEKVVATVDRATEAMISQTGIEARIILCTLRHYTDSQSMLTAELVNQFKGSRVVALDIAGDEAGFPLQPHVAAFEFAREHDLHRTAHAGEAMGPESVRETLDRLQPTRIGHGVRSIEDPALIEQLATNRIHLEVCPSSNIQILPQVTDWSDHPIDKLYRAKVPLNINTDTRMLTPVTLRDEYEGMQKTFGWTLEELRDTNLLAVDAAFVDDTTKHRLRTRIVEAYV